MNETVHGCEHPDALFPDWPRDFGRAGRASQRLCLEIGPGRGAFALDHAAAHPELDLVAIETRRSDCEEIRAKAARRKIHNLMVIHGDAKLLAPRLFRPGASWPRCTSSSLIRGGRSGTRSGGWSTSSWRP